HPLRLVGDGVGDLLLRADEEHGPALRREVTDEGIAALDALQRLQEVDDVDPAALGEDVPAHLGVPPPGLVPEMDARLQQLLHGNDGHAAPFRFWPPSGEAGPSACVSPRPEPGHPRVRGACGMTTEWCFLPFYAARW